MELSIGLEDLDTENLDEEEVKEESFLEVLSESSIVPKEGMYLGLDISETSTGICIYDSGKKYLYNSELDDFEGSPHREVLLRRELKEDLLSIIQGKTFEVIIIEDAYQGVNPLTTRLLYALNTAIDEMILDNQVFCKEFLRVQNSVWKSWLFSIDTENNFKGLNDKEKIQRCLEMLGVHEEGKGFQDRLDATGMILGYLICKKSAKKSLLSKKKKRVVLSDINFSYDTDIDFIKMDINGDVDHFSLINSTGRMSKTKIIELLTNDPTIAYVTENCIKLGRLADELDLPYIPEGGIFAFWVKPNKVKKYLKNLKYKEMEEE